MTKVFVIVLVFASCTLASTWYVRPLGTDYGAENGEAYATAWEGLAAVVWGGGGGVVAGDALYVCGTHIRDESNGSVSAADYVITPTSGTSGNPTIIRGDYPGDAGYIYGWRQKSGAWNNEGGGLWSIALDAGIHSESILENPSGATFTPLVKSYTHSNLTGTWTFTNTSTAVEALGADGDAVNDGLAAGDFIRKNSASSTTDWYLVTVVAQHEITINTAYTGTTGAAAEDASQWEDATASLADCTATAGTQYAATYANGATLYVHPTNGNDPAEQVVLNRYGTQFLLDSVEYITFLNLHFYQHWRFANTETYNHITWDGCTLMYGGSSVLIRIYDDSDNNTVTDCTMAYCGSGIYTIFGSPSSDVSDNNTFTNNTIYNLGTLTGYIDGDNHAIGLQGGTNTLIDGNTIWNCGTGITMYSGETSTFTNYTISNNLIYGLNDSGNNRGIETQINVSNVADHSGNTIYCNIIHDCTVGLRGQFHDETTWYNNTIYNCTTGFLTLRTTGNNTLRNNIFLNCTTNISATAAGTPVVNSDYNLFYPVTGDCFFISSGGEPGGNYTWTEWKAYNWGVGTDDGNSLDEPPQLIGVERNKFAPVDGSRVVGAGEDVSLPSDFRGNPISTDIGAIAYTQYGGF